MKQFLLVGAQVRLVNTVHSKAPVQGTEHPVLVELVRRDSRGGGLRSAIVECELHTDVQRVENFRGIFVLERVHDCAWHREVLSEKQRFRATPSAQVPPNNRLVWVTHGDANLRVVCKLAAVCCLAMGLHANDEI